MFLEGIGILLLWQEQGPYYVYDGTARRLTWWLNKYSQ